MSYISLYRKWRPHTFDEVRGQDAVVTTLKNQIKSGRTGHAYIFIGTRGTGKTSVARIMAAALNCENLQDGNPCCECASCKSIMSGEAMNVREIDAASNNGVENMREINEDVVFPPAQGKSKVYIIDEVHMLSTSAFNALLKTLEEPPDYVTFILATTETSKIPLTIFSRCQRYDFRMISVEDIKAQLKRLAENEELEMEERACEYIAKKADGAMRDALSLMDRCAAYAMGDPITYDLVLKAIGAVDTEIFSRLFKCVASADTAGCIKCLDEVMTGGGVISTFITDFIGYLRNLLLLSAAGDQDISGLLEATDENVARMKEEAALTDAGILSMYIRSLSALLYDLRQTNQQRTVTEVAFIKLTRPALGGNESDAAAVKRIQALEKQLGEMKREYAEVAASGYGEYFGKCHAEHAESPSVATVEVYKNGNLRFPEPAGGYPEQIRQSRAVEGYNNENIRFPSTSSGNQGTSSGNREKSPVTRKDNRTPYDDLSESMKTVVGFWDTVVNEFKTPKLIDQTLKRCKLAVKDGQTLEIMVESRMCFDNLNGEAGTGRSNIEELRDFISTMFGGMKIPVELTLLEKGESDRIQGLNELVHMTIEADERKDDV